MHRYASKIIRKNVAHGAGLSIRASGRRCELHGGKATGPNTPCQRCNSAPPIRAINASMPACDVSITAHSLEAISEDVVAVVLIGADIARPSLRA